MKSNSLTTWISLLAKIGLNAAIIPIVAHKLDLIEANLWLMLITIFSITMVFDFGLTPTISRYVSYALNDKAKIKSPNNINTYTMEDVICVIKVTYNILGLASFLVSLQVMYWLLETKIGKLNQPLDGYYAILFMSIAIGVTLNGGGAIAYLQGKSKIYVYRNIESLATISTIIILLVVVEFFSSLMIVAAIYSAGQIIALSWIGYIARSDQTKLNIENNSYKKIILQEIIGVSWKSGLGIASTYIAIQSIGIIVSLLATPEEGNFFLLAQRIMQAVASLGNVPFYVTLPKLAEAYIQNNRQYIFESTKKTILQSNILTAASLTIIGYCWLNFEKIAPIGFSLRAFEFSSVPWFYLCVALIIERAGAMYLQIYTLSNIVIWHKLNSLSSVVMLAGMPILYKYMGVEGLPASIIISYLLIYLPVSIVKSSLILGSNTGQHLLTTSGFVLLLFIFANSIIIL